MFHWVLPRVAPTQHGVSRLHRMLRTDELDYDLPPDLIATRPHEPRDECRLLVISWSEPSRLEDRRFCELPDLLARGDTLVFNTTAVIPARFSAIRSSTGGRVTGLFLNQESDVKWRVMLKSNSRLRPGLDLALLDREGEPSEHSLRLLEKHDAEWIATLNSPNAQRSIEDIGATPLPPYILSARRDNGESIEDDLDREWYQTVYADRADANSVAAPTAGLHFTDRLLDRLSSSGVERADLCLDVGPGTFKPVQSETLHEHDMHTEHFAIPASTLRTLRDLRAKGGRCIPVGTTSVRALESLPEPLPDPGGPFSSSTELMISPGYDFRFTDGLITNFHLPRSTLMALVAALLPGGLQQLKDVYAHAVAERYRFYSYGDAMLLLP